MKRRLILAVAFVVTVALASVGGTKIINALERKTYTTTYSMQVDGMTRSWEVIGPVAALPKSAPIIVMLSGIAASVSDEVNRDRFLPYVSNDMEELVYPAGYEESWNAGGCCGKAATKNIDDVAFLKALVPRVDPGHQHPIFLVGYSNGGRMAYRMACTVPGLFNGIAVAKAMPMPGCVVTHPTTFLQMDATNDPAVAFKPGDKGRETPAATVEVGRLRAADQCSERKVASRFPTMTLTTWENCASGTRLQFAAYSVGAHGFPFTRGSTPGAAELIYAFFTKTAIAPYPK
jgi:polyhydroxybutyrate depolymerase